MDITSVFKPTSHRVNFESVDNEGFVQKRQGESKRECMSLTDYSRMSKNMAFESRLERNSNMLNTATASL